MINANELRIGNYIRFAEDGTIFKVDGIYPTGFDVSNGVEQTWIESDTFEGIPFTSEFLISNGFKKRFDSDDCNIWDLESNAFLNGSMTLALISRGWKMLVCPPAQPFHFIHQLQNLYFALTGKDLILTPSLH